MADSDIQQFIGVSGASAEAANFYLESSNGNLEAAVDAFWENGGAQPSIVPPTSEDTPLGNPVEASSPSDQVVQAPLPHLPLPASNASAAGVAPVSSGSQQVLRKCIASVLLLVTAHKTSAGCWLKLTDLARPSWSTRLIDGSCRLFCCPSVLCNMACGSAVS